MQMQLNYVRLVWCSLANVLIWSVLKMFCEISCQKYAKTQTTLLHHQ